MYRTEEPAVDDSSVIDKRDKADLLRWITLGIGIGFLTISFINFILFKRYQRKEEI